MQLINFYKMLLFLPVYKLIASLRSRGVRKGDRFHVKTSHNHSLISVIYLGACASVLNIRLESRALAVSFRGHVICY